MRGGGGGREREKSCIVVRGYAIEGVVLSNPWLWRVEFRQKLFCRTVEHAQFPF